MFVLFLASQDADDDEDDEDDDEYDEDDDDGDNDDPFLCVIKCSHIEMRSSNGILRRLGTRVFEKVELSQKTLFPCIVQRLLYLFLFVK